MKDGLIQNIFRKYHDEPLLFYGYKSDLNQLQRELIQEIKKVMPSCKCDACMSNMKTYHNYNRDFYLKKLIGDSQE